MDANDWIILGSILAFLCITFIIAGICESKSEGGGIFGAMWPLWPILLLMYGSMVLGEKIGKKLKK